MIKKKNKIHINPKVAIDIETTGLNFLEDKVICVSLYDGKEHKFFKGPFESPADKQALQEALIEYDVNKYEFTFHNGSFDTKFLWPLIGKRFARPNGAGSLFNDFDCMVAAYLLSKQPTKLSLEACCSYYLGLPPWKDKDHYTDPEYLKEVVKEDTENTYALAHELERLLKEEDRYDFFLKLMSVRNLLTEAEFKGFMFDVEKSKKLIAELTINKNELLNKLKQLSPDVKNWRSPKQVLKLFKSLGLNVIDPVTKKESTGARVLEMNKDKHEIPQTLSEYKAKEKMIKSLTQYGTEHLNKFGAINCNFNVTNTRTGRLSSSSPNMQQVDGDKRVRELFIAAPGKELVVGDMSQIEVRMAAHYSKDPALLNMFREGLDFYGVIARDVLKKDIHPNELKEKDPKARAVAKVIGLSILYGCGSNRLRNGILEATGEDIGHDGARQIIKNYFDTFEGLKSLRTTVDRILTERGYLINLYGRKVDISQDKIYMTGVNSLLQSSASDMLLFNQHKIKEAAPWADLLSLVHDEAIYEVPEGMGKELLPILKNIMEDVNISDTVKFRVPLLFPADVGNNWGIK